MVVVRWTGVASLSIPSEIPERGWQDAAFAVSGLLGTVVSVVVLVWKEPTLAVGIVAGAGWALSVGLLFSGGAQRTRIRRLEADLLEERRKTGEFSATSKNVSEAVVTLMNALPLAQQNPPPRAVARREPEAELNQNPGGQQ